MRRLLYRMKFQSASLQTTWRLSMFTTRRLLTQNTRGNGLSSGEKYTHFDGKESKLTFKPKRGCKVLWWQLSSLHDDQEVTLKCRCDGKPGLPIHSSACSVVSSLTPCTSEEKKPPSRASVVELTLLPQLDGSMLVVAGTTNLKDGALIRYEVQHELLGKHPLKPWMAEGTATVKAGRYSAKVPVSGWPRGKVTVWAGFDCVVTPPQPKWVTTQFGERGERMEGPTVSLSGKA